MNPLRTISMPAMPGNPKGIESISPGLARQRLPWIACKRKTNPNGVASFSICIQMQPFQGWENRAGVSQGSSPARNPGLIDGIPLGFSRGSSFKLRSYCRQRLCRRIASGLPPAEIRDR